MPRDRKDFLLTDDEVQLREQKRRRLLFTVVIILVLGAVIALAGRPVAGAIKGWQARRHAQKAFASLDAAKWSEARNEAVAAYQLRSSEPAALRAVARFLSRTRQAQALDFWSQLAKVEKLTREDLRDEATVALVSGETARADSAIKELLEREPSAVGPMDYLLAAQSALQKGHPQEALASVRKVLANSSANERERLQAAVVMLQTANPAEPAAAAQQQDEAWSHITDLSRGKDATALDALMLLARRDLSLDPKSAPRTPSVPDLISAIDNHSLAKAPQKLTALDLRIHQDPASKEENIARAIAQWKDAEPADVIALATWLNGKGEFERELDVIPLQRAMQDRELFLQHVDALGALGRWDEIKRLLDTERFPLDPVIQRMYLARCNAQLGNEAAATNNWQRALEAAAGDPVKLITLAEYAEKNGAAETAGAAYTQAATDAPKFRAAQQGRLRAAQAAHDTKKMHAILAEMQQLWPNDTAIQNDEAYTRLLLLDAEQTGKVESLKAKVENRPEVAEPRSDLGNQRSEAGSQKSGADLRSPTSDLRSATSELLAIEKLARELVAKEPASLPHRTLLALARLRASRPDEALKVYEAIQVAPNALTPSALAIHAAVLNASGHEEDAKTEIAKVPKEALLPEEETLVANLRL